MKVNLLRATLKLNIKKSRKKQNYYLAMKQIIKGSIKLRWTKTKTNFLMEWPHITKQNLVPFYTQLTITPETTFIPFSILLSKSLLRSSHYHNTNTGVRNARRNNSVNNEKYPTINLEGGKMPVKWARLRSATYRKHIYMRTSPQ